MTIFSSIIRVYSLYIRINGDSLYTGQYWPVLSIAWRLKQGQIKKEG